MGHRARGAEHRAQSTGHRAQGTGRKRLQDRRTKDTGSIKERLIGNFHVICNYSINYEQYNIK